MKLHSTVGFRCGVLQLDLTPDSRNYVLFSLWRINPDVKTEQPMRLSVQRLTCEYLTDLLTVSIEAVNWITANCIDIKADDGRHLYFQFKEEPDATVFVEAELRNG